MKFELISESPFDLLRCSSIFSRFPWDGTDVWLQARETMPAQYRRLHTRGAEAILASVEQGSGENRLLVWTHPSRPRHLRELQERVAWQLHLDASLAGFNERARQHHVFGPLLKTLSGVRPLRPSTLFEMAVIAISEQQLSLPAAAKIRGRLIQALGEKMDFDGREYRAFPTPEAIASCRMSKLRGLSFSARKAEYLIELSRRVARDGFPLEDLRHKSNEEIISILTSFRGFGRWSAEYFLARGLGRTEVVAADDLGIQTLVGKVLGPGRRVTAEELRLILEPWGKDKRWVVFYLFCASRMGLLN